MLDFPDDGQIRFRKLRDAGSVLNATLAFVRRNARELTTSYLALVAPVALASGLSIALYFRQFGDIFSDPEALLNGDVSLFGWSYVGVLLFSTLGAALAQAAGAGYVRLYRQGEAGTITVGRLWEESRGLLLPFMGLPILYAIVVMLAAVVAIVPCLGALAWVGFMVWSFPYYAVTLASRAIDTDSVAEAWQRSRTLVKGSWGFAAGAILLTFLILIVVSFGIMMVFSAVVGVVLAGTMADDPTQIMGWMGAIYAPVQIVSYALYILVTVAVFFVHGRLAEEVDGTTMRDDLDVLAEAGFDAPRPELRSTPLRPDLPSDPPPASAPDDLPNDSPLGDDPTGDAPSGFRGGGFGA